MKNIDRIIQFLSGEMLGKEKNQFQSDLKIDKELNKEFNTLTRVWELMKDQLKLEEGPSDLSREELLAELLAEHDVQFYKQRPTGKKEERFKSTLQNAMRGKPEREVEGRKIHPGIISAFGFVAAAAIAVMIILTHPAPGINDLYNQYYQPATDPVFEPISITSRSEIEHALVLFSQGEFDAAREVSLKQLNLYPDIEELKILYALSCFETGDVDRAESLFKEVIQSGDGGTCISARWYLALLYIKTGNIEGARKYLDELKKANDQHSREASRLLRKLK